MSTPPSDASTNSDSFEKVNMADINNMVPDSTDDLLGDFDPLSQPIQEESDKTIMEPEAPPVEPEKDSDVSSTTTPPAVVLPSSPDELSTDLAEFKGKAAKSKPSSQKCNVRDCLSGIDPKVVDLIYWANWKHSAAAFAVSFFLLLSFRKYLDEDLKIPSDKAHGHLDSLINRANVRLSKLRDLFLIVNVADSVKFGLLLWFLTYIGAWFNGLTLLLIGDVMLFTVPKFYETYQTEIDEKASMLKHQLDILLTKLKQKLPPLPWAKPKTQ